MKKFLSLPLKISLALSLSTLLHSCGGDDTTGNPMLDTPVQDVEEDDLFEKNTVVHYQVNLPEEDWNTLRYEGRSLLGACPSFEGYTFFNGRVTVDGVVIDDVEIRKKGSIGSLSTQKPSIKLDFGDGEINEGRIHRGHRRVTLNNSKQDATFVETCLGYEVFRRAGIHTPLCNLGRVSYQDQELGVYAHVENIKKPFLERVFGDDSGNLYEGAGSDFNMGRIDTFEKKTNEIENDYSDLQAVLGALATDDNNVIAALDQVLDMEGFITYIAVEALIGHTDSYSGFQNNFFIYNNPSDGKFHFIPWGADQTFQENHLIFNTTFPQTIHLSSSLTQRLWGIEAFRIRYDEKMQELLDTVWDEVFLISEVERLSALVDTQHKTEDIIDFIERRRGVIQAELGTERFLLGGAPRTNQSTGGCRPLDSLNRFVMEFSTNTTDQGQYNIFSDTFDFESFDQNGFFDINATFFGQALEYDSSPGTGETGIRVRIAERNFFADSPQAEIQVFIRGEGTQDNIIFYLPVGDLKTGTYPFHGFDTVGIAYGDNFGFTFLSEGTITLGLEGTDPGNSISGRIETYY